MFKSMTTALLLIFPAMALAIDSPVISIDAAGRIKAASVSAEIEGFNIYLNGEYFNTIKTNLGSGFTFEESGSYCLVAFTFSGEYSSCSNQVSYQGINHYLSTLPERALAPVGQEVCIVTTVLVDGVALGFPRTNCY